MILAANENDRNPIEIDGIKAILHYSGEPEEIDLFQDAYNGLEDVFKKCFKYADKVWSSTNYKAQCLLFLKLFQENYEQIDSCLVQKHKENTQKKIDKLTKELSWGTIVPDLSYAANSCIQNKIEAINKFIIYNEKELSQLKEDSNKYREVKAKIDKYKK